MSKHDWVTDERGVEFDERAAQTFVGKYVLVGMEYVDERDRLSNLVQLHGVIERASREGFTVALGGTRKGETWTMPPSLTALHPAGPGEYRLKSTGEVVVDPDYTAVWTIKPPQKH